MENAHLLRGIQLIGLEKPREAEAELKKAVLISPENPGIHALLGLVYLHQSKYVPAKGAAEEALALNPEIALPYKVLAWVAVARETDFKKGIELFEKAISLDNEELSFKIDLARVYLVNEQHQKSHEMVDLVLSADPEYIDAILLKGELLESFFKHKEAQEWYDKALSLDPNRSDTHFQKGRSGLVLGNIDQAMDHLGSSIKLDPTQNESLLAMGDSLVAQKVSILIPWVKLKQISTAVFYPGKFAIVFLAMVPIFVIDKNVEVGSSFYSASRIIVFSLLAFNLIYWGFYPLLRYYLRSKQWNYWLINWRDPELWISLSFFIAWMGVGYWQLTDDFTGMIVAAVAMLTTLQLSLYLTEEEDIRLKRFYGVYTILLYGSAMLGGLADLLNISIPKLVTGSFLILWLAFVLFLGAFQKYILKTNSILDD